MGLTGSLVALSAVQAGTTLATSYSSAKATTAAANYQAQIAEQNSRLADIQAADAIRRGESEVEKIRQRKKAVISSQRVAGAAQGQDIEGEESDNAKIQADTAMFGELDVRDTRINSWRESWGYQVNAQQLRSSAQFTRLTGKNVARNTLLTGGLTAVSGLASNYYSYKNRDNWSLKDLIEKTK